jgi:hypothetical protein
VRSLDKVNESTRGSDENITALGELIGLIPQRTTSVDHTRTEHSSIAELPSLVEDLDG